MNVTGNPPKDGPQDEAVWLATNDFPVNWKEAQVYKYTIHVSPESIATKEKKALAKKFVAQMKPSLKNSTFVHNDNFEFYFPTIQPGLENKFFQVVCFRQKDTFEGAVVSYVCGKKVYTKFLTGELITRQPGQDPFEAYAGGGDPCLTLCTVQAKMEVINADYIKESVRTNCEQQRTVVINAIDNILWQEARDTPSVQVCGNRIFDVSSKPALEGPLVELRGGINVATCVVNSSYVRRINPCMGFFLKSMRLSELLRLLCSTNTGTGPDLSAEQVENALKGVTIRKTYGKQEVAQIEGFTVGNPEQETFYWNNHKTTTISHYMEKVYHAEDVNKYPEQKCVVVGSQKRTEILPCSMCFVLPGQYFPLPASSLYFENDAEQVYHASLRDIPSSYVSLTDGLLTKMLKCSASPTVAAEFGLQVSGIAERLHLKGSRGDEYKPLTEARIIETEIAASKKSSNFEQPILVLAFTSSDAQKLKNRHSKVFNNHAQFIKSKDVSIHAARPYHDNDVEKLITDARGELAKKDALGEKCKPAIIGIFQKPQRSGEVTQQETELEGLRFTYEALKLHCHKNGFHFVGTFLPPAFDSPNDHKTGTIVSNAVQRLRTQIKSVASPAFHPVSMFDRGGTLLLGIHVSQLDHCPDERNGEIHSVSPHSSAERAPYWYVVSLAAKWCGSTGFHRVRTFLQKSCKPKEGFPQTYPGALAMIQIEKSIRELLGGISLSGCDIVVLRAGIPAGEFTLEERAALEAIESRQAADTEAPAANLASPDLGASEAENRCNDTLDERTGVEDKATAEDEKLGLSNGDDNEAVESREAVHTEAVAANLAPLDPWALEAEYCCNDTLDERTGVEDKATAEDQQLGLSNGGDNEPDNFHTASAYDSCEDSDERSDNHHQPQTKALLNSELQCFLEFAGRESARLAYVETGVKTLFRLFEHEGQPLCGRESSTIGGKGRTNSSGSKTVTSVLIARSSSTGLVGSPAEWMIQKRLPKRAGPNTPVALKVHCGGSGSIPIENLRHLLADALWDFPEGTWSSKTFACVALAMKANRHAKRIVRFLNGRPDLADVNADLKDCLYFI